MSSSTAEVRIRRMGAADVDRVLEIAGGLSEAPHWPSSAYVEAIDPKHIPQRIAIVAELRSEEQTSGAQAHANSIDLIATAKTPTYLSRDVAREGSSTRHGGAPFQDEGSGSASGRVVGFAVVGLVAPEAELETIAVGAEARRRGVGGLLLRALVEELRKKRVTELILEVRASNRAALGFYRAQGFKETGRRLRYYADPEEDAVLMGLNLA
jgi:ribosomal-protein-alanine acetyltransferase